MFLSGILPMSSAVTTSTTSVDFFLTVSAASSEARMPVITTSWSWSACAGAVPLACCACSTSLRPNSAMATAVPINVDRAILMIYPTPNVCR